MRLLSLNSHAVSDAESAIVTTGTINQLMLSVVLSRLEQSSQMGRQQRTQLLLNAQAVLRERVGDATKSGAAEATAAAPREQIAANFSRALTNSAPWS
jgi:hypothetical protein